MLTERHTDPISGFFGVAVFCFYDSLVRLSLLPETPVLQRFGIFRKIADNQKKMRLWADHAPANFLHKWHLVEAELARYRGDVVKANRAYDQAICLARKHNFLQEEALAFERAAEHYLAQGIEAIAILCLQQALLGYRRWGASAKVRALEMRYPHWLDNRGAVFTALTQKGDATFTTSTNSANLLDIAAVVKASQVLSQEIVLANLLKRLMQLALESAGAQRGVLLLKKEGHWFVEAEKVETQNQTDVLQAIELNPSDDAQTWLPISLFHYVTHTGKSVLVHEASDDKLVAEDPYVRQWQPRSLMIVPLHHQGELVGILYFENNAISGAFTDSRLQVLQLLASQAAISIESARLYAEMEERVAVRSAELKTIPARAD